MFEVRRAVKKWGMFLGFGVLVAAVVFSSRSALASDFVEMGKAAGLSFGRNAINGYLEIRKEGEPVKVDIDNRLNFYLQGAFEFHGKPYVLVYNTAENVPSGRRLSRGTEGSDLYAVSIKDGTAAFEKLATLPVGIDVRLQVSRQDDSVLACLTTVCVLLKADTKGSVKQSIIKLPTGQELVELAGSRLLLQKVFNDQADDFPSADVPIFSTCNLQNDSVACLDVPATVVPYDLKEDGSYSVVRGFEDVLYFDYERLGLANYSEPNLEGRITWSNVYFLTGIADLYRIGVSEGFRASIRDRLVQEFEAIARLQETVYPGLKVRRYSIDREPIDFLLHFSRLAKAVERARPAIGDAMADRILARLLGEIREPRSTIEQLVKDAGGHAELEYRRYVPFWADGVNVPWNFQSAWIEALSLTGIPDELRQPAASMLETFAREEKLSTRPRKWSYAGGVFHQGWSDGRSFNTPEWAGQKQTAAPAHISYRSMDALALLAAKKAGIEAVPDFDRYASELIGQGFLYPFVNEGLTQPVRIPFGIARHYARSYLPWQFQNQVWALESLSR